MTDQGQLDNIDLTPAQLGELKRLLQQYLPDTQVWAYGSRVTFKSRPESDLDLVAFATKELSRSVGDFREALEESDLPFSVDVMVWDTMPEHFKPIIEKAYYVLQMSDIPFKAEGWETVKLEQVCQVVGGGTPSTKISENYGGEVPWITPKDLSSHKERYIQRGERNITSAGLKNSSAKLLPKDSVLYSTRAPIGYIAIAMNEVCTNQGFKSLVLNDGQCPEFYYYLMKHYTPSIKAKASGSTFEEVSGSVIKALEVSIPNFQNQKAIAHILGTLDGKIELNHKMNQKLEDIAKAIFKSWFVDFEPVRAKAEGRPTGLPPEISDLFPEKLIGSENGEIPEGWNCSSTDNFFDITIGRTPPRKESKWFSENNSDIPWVSIKDMGTGEAFISKTNESLTMDAITQHNIRIIPAGTSILSFKLTVGRVSILTKSMVTNEAIAHFVPSGKFPHAYYTYFYLKHFNYNSLGSTSSIATAVNSKIIRNLPFLAPRNDLLQSFQDLISPIMSRIEVSMAESDLLSTLRDTLLPKLISGELRIPDAEKFLEQAGL